MKRFAPECGWPRFRQWAIAAMACQSCFTHAQKLTRAHTHLVTAASLCHWLLIGYRHRSRPIEDEIVGRRRNTHRVDLASVCEVIYWMLTIQSHIGLGNVAEGKWGPEFLPVEVVQPAVATARARARQIGICPWRLEKLTEVAERKEADLPALMELAQHYPALSNFKVGPGDPEYHKDRYHGFCTPEECGPNKADTEQMTQLHKCPSWQRDACGQHPVKYSVEALERSIEAKRGSQWSRFEPRMAAPGEPYVAISHVWIDGTGVGNGPKGPNGKASSNQGNVNRCLNDYFARIAGRENCSAIWWDTISLPTNPKIRLQEIHKMQNTYRDATHTIVHDNGLLDFEWADDGSPCVALVLSAWFTRGWTALELHVSRRSLKVLYKGPNPQTPLIKDLDKDILAHDPRNTTRAHWIASSIIRRLRQRVENVRDMLSILRPRATCRVKDRTTIAGLLADLDPPTCTECTNPPFEDDPEAKKQAFNKHVEMHTTRRVLTTLGKVGCASLIHDKEPMENSGPFSWTPSAVHDMPVNSGGDLQPGIFGDGMLDVDQYGRVMGSWHYRGLTRDDAAYFVEAIDSDNEGMVTRITDALRHWQNCLILRELPQDKGPALLATTVGKESVNGRTITDCHYVGGVTVRADNNPYGESYDIRYSYGTVRFGNENGRPDMRARDIVQLRDAAPSDEESYNGEDSEEVPEDGEEEGWISSDSDGPRRPRGMF
jgi:hypothetical protein